LSSAQKDLATVSTYPSADVSTPLRILSWNVHGDLAIKLTSPEFVNFLLLFDVCLLQETHLRAQQSDSLPVPEGFALYSVCRPCRDDLGHPGGGVAAFVRSSLECKVREDIASHAPDMLVLDLVSFSILCSYIPPESSPWHNWAQTKPIQRFSELVAMCACSSNKPVLIMGDLNARIASCQNRTPGSQTRVSSDSMINARGHRLINICSDNDLTIINGTILECFSPGGYTSFQPMGCSVIDYVIMSMPLIQHTLSMKIDLKVGLEWSDHGALCLMLDSAVLPSTPISHFMPAYGAVAESMTKPCSALDELLKMTLSKSESPDDAIYNFYGPVYYDDNAVTVFTDGSCLTDNLNNKRAGAGVFWGTNDSRNAALRVPGMPTNNRAEIYAILWAVTHAPPKCRLQVYTDSQYAIHSICHWAVANDSCGWKCLNADILQDLIGVLRLRLAPTVFTWVKGHNNNYHNEMADKLAYEGALLDKYCPTYNCPQSRSAPNLPPLTAELKISKVFTNLPRIPVPSAKRVSLSLDDINSSNTHRGRVKV